MDHSARPAVRKEAGHPLPVRQVQIVMPVVRTGQQLIQPCLLQRRVIVGVEIVHADDRLTPLKQLPGCVEANEACGSGDENRVV